MQRKLPIVGFIIVAVISGLLIMYWPIRATKQGGGGLNAIQLKANGFHAKEYIDSSLRDSVESPVSTSRQDRIFRGEIENLRSELRQAERSRIVDRTSATLEIPVSESMMKALRLPPGTTKRLIDAKYLSIRAPTVEERLSMENLINRSENAIFDQFHSDGKEFYFERLKSEFLNYPKNFKVLALTRPKGESGRFRLTSYNTDEVYELNNGNGIELSPDEFEGSFEDFEVVHGAIDRYGYLFEVKEER